MIWRVVPATGGKILGLISLLSLLGPTGAVDAVILSRDTLTSIRAEITEWDDTRGPV